MIFSLIGPSSFENNGFTYTGTCSVDYYTDFAILQLKTSGTLTFKRDRVFDAFLIGGGGAGGCTSKVGGGGGGGYITILQGGRYAQLLENNGYSITIGSGGIATGGQGGTSNIHFHRNGSLTGMEALGGYGGVGTGDTSATRKGGNGSSGGGGASYGSGKTGGAGGSNLSNGSKGSYTSGNSSKAGAGGTASVPKIYYATSTSLSLIDTMPTTHISAYAFGEKNDVYGYGLFGGGGGGGSATTTRTSGGAGGGGYGGGTSSSYPRTAGATNTGGGGGGADPSYKYPANGGSGVILLKIYGDVVKL